MNVRAIALALPLVVGVAACKTSSTQGSTGSTTASSTEPSQSSQNQSTAGHPETGGNASASATVDPGATSGSAQGSASAGTSGEASASTSGGTSADMPAGAYSSTTTPKAHSDDRTVTGKVTRISEDSLAIDSDMGMEKTLQLVPQTSVTIDGQDAHRTDLKEGQEIRASFNTVDGEDIAVEIEAHQSGSMQGGSTGTSGSTPSDLGTGSGTMQGGSSTGTSGSSTTGSGSSTTPDTTTTK
jgi:hypothetical protein